MAQIWGWELPPSLEVNGVRLISANEHPGLIDDVGRLGKNDSKSTNGWFNQEGPD